MVKIKERSVDVSDKTKAERSGGIEVGEEVAESARSQRKGHGQWTEDEEQLLPKNNIPLVFFALLLTMFLVSICY